jgi:hypothetical protein
MRLGCIDARAAAQAAAPATPPPSDVRKLLAYRPDVFGRGFCEALESALRGPSAWSVGERELFAAYTSRLEACRF